METEPLVFRMGDKGPSVVREVLLGKGWEEYDEDDPSLGERWNLWWKQSRFTPSQQNCHYPYQRVNHYPKSSLITKKDALLRNLRRMRVVYGWICDFVPDSWILPQEYVKFCQVYADAQDQAENNAPPVWICKPSDLSRGRKIFVFRDIKLLTYDSTAVVQRYVDPPFLIHNHKFDLRVYVLVTSFQPLRIYMYRDVIVRFATDRYDTSKLDNIYSHLTNTSLNKHAPNYDGNKHGIGEGCKWRIQQLQQHLSACINSLPGSARSGSSPTTFDMAPLWGRMETIAITTLLSIGPSIPANPPCFELYGFDILFDSSFRPWLLEVNFSPALSMDGPVDDAVKTAMISDLVDTLNIRPFDAGFMPIPAQATASAGSTVSRSSGYRPRNPVELTAAAAAKQGATVPYPLPRGYSRQPCPEQTDPQTATEQPRPKPKRGHSVPVLRPPGGTRSAEPEKPARQAVLPAVSRTELVDRPSGDYALIFPFSPETEKLAAEIAKGEQVIRAIINELKPIEAAHARRCKQYAQIWAEKAD